MKWALRGENRALSDVTNQIWELNNVWSEAQNKFIGNDIFLVVNKIFPYCVFTLIAFMLCKTAHDLEDHNIQTII